MPEINLPTSQQVNGIDEKLDEVLANFPINAGTDFFAGINQLVSTSTTITGKGIVTSMTNDNSGMIVDVSITPDNGTAFPFQITPNSSVGVFIPFKTKCVLSISSTAGAVGYILM